MPFTVSEQSSPPVITITEKFLGSVERDDFKQTIDRLKDAGQTSVVVDLSKTDFMDSTGIGLLVSGLTTMREAGGDVRLANVKERIRGVFIMTKLLSVFKDYPSVEDAAQSFETDPPHEAPAGVQNSTGAR